MAQRVPMYVTSESAAPSAFWSSNRQYWSHSLVDMCWVELTRKWSVRDPMLQAQEGTVGKGDVYLQARETDRAFPWNGDTSLLKIKCRGEAIVPYLPQEQFPFWHDVQTPDSAKNLRMHRRGHVIDVIFLLKECCVTWLGSICTWFSKGPILCVTHRRTIRKFNTFNTSCCCWFKEWINRSNVPPLIVEE